MNKPKKLLALALLVAAAALAQTDLPGPVRSLPDELHAAPGAFGGWDAAQAFFAGLTAPATSSLVSGTYVSGITATGSATQTCTLTTFNGGNTGGTATVALTGTNAIAGGTALIITAQGTGNTVPSTSATAGSGTATCSGTAVLTTVVDQAWAMPGSDGGSGLCWGWSSAYKLGWVSCSGGTNFWGLSGSDLSPVGNYNLLPNGTSNIGNSGLYWNDSFVVDTFTNQIFIELAGANKASIGWDATNGAVAITVPVWGALFEFDAGGQNTSFADLDPDMTDARKLGSSGDEWNDLYVKNLHCTGTGCAGTNFWGLSGSDLSPVGNYNLLPNGTSNIGNSGLYWNDSFVVGTFTNQIFIELAGANKASIGWDATNGAVSVTVPVWGALFEFDAGGQNTSFADLLPNATNTRKLGSTSFRWSEVDAVNLNISGTCTGCPAGTGTVTSVATTSPITGGTFTTSGTIGCSTCLVTGGGQTISGSDETVNVNILTAGGKNIGSSSQFWSIIYGTTLVTGGLDLDNGSSLVQRLGYDSSTGGTAFVNNVSARVFGILQTGGAITYGVIEPSATSTDDLGTTGLYFNNAYINTVNAATAVVAPIYDVTGGFFGQDLTGGLSVTTGGGVCKIFFKSGIIYALSGTPSTAAACI